MIITNKETLESYCEDMISSKHPMLFHINEDGQLVLENHWSCDLFLAYIRGDWVASGFEKDGKAKFNNKVQQHLFAIGNKLYMEPTGTGKYEVATPNIPLSKAHHSFLLFCHGMQIGMVIADGSKSSTVLMEEFRTSRNMWKLLLLSICAMIRQYDNNAADEIEGFWNLSEEEPVVDPKKIAKTSIFHNEKTSYGP